MPKAKTYIYRNLHRGGFSSKFKGIVRSRFGSKHPVDTYAIVINPGFQVSQKVREKIANGSSKQVHAYITTDLIWSSNGRVKGVDNAPVIKYNPRIDSAFHVSDGTSIDDVVLVLFMDDRVYAFTKRTVKDYPNLVEALDSFVDVFSPKEV